LQISGKIVIQAVSYIARPTPRIESACSSNLHNSETDATVLVGDFFMTLSRTCLLACLLVGMVPALARAEDKFNMDVKADGVSLGKTVMGSEISSADLKGRVVMIEFWGIN
jgi:hypothetical protein